MTRILGEYTTLAGEPRRLVAARRTGPSGWCLLDIPTRADAPADDFQIVRRLGDLSTFGAVAEDWGARAAVSPLAENWFGWWLAVQARRGALPFKATVDIYNDRFGMRRLVLVEDPSCDGCCHLVDLPVGQHGAAGILVAAALHDVDDARDFAAAHVERQLLRVAAGDAMTPGVI